MIRKRELLEDLHALVLDLRCDIRDLKAQVSVLTQRLQDSQKKVDGVQTNPQDEISTSSIYRVFPSRDSGYLIIDDEFVKEPKK